MKTLRNAFSLVVLRYRIPRTRIIELAPFLFVLAVERSLERRRVRLDAVKEALDRADDAAAGFHHLPKTIAPGFEADDAISAERDSVAQRDLLAERLGDDLYSLFGPQKENYDADRDNPFVSSLQEDAPDPDIAAITSFSRTGVDFRVCRADALKLAGGDERLAAGILDGWAPLYEMPLELRIASFSRKELAELGADDENAERRLAWLRERADEHEAALARGANLSLEDLGL